MAIGGVEDARSPPPQSCRSSAVPCPLRPATSRRPGRGISGTARQPRRAASSMLFLIATASTLTAIGLWFWKRRLQRLRPSRANRRRRPGGKDRATDKCRARRTAAQERGSRPAKQAKRSLGVAGPRQPRLPDVAGEGVPSRHVALRRIDERFRGAAAYVKWEKQLQRLAKNVAAHIDLNAVEYYDDYVLYRRHRPHSLGPNWSARLRKVPRDSRRRCCACSSRIRRGRT